jgi:hypothetical protein
MHAARQVGQIGSEVMIMGMGYLGSASGDTGDSPAPVEELSGDGKADTGRGAGD